MFTRTLLLFLAFCCLAIQPVVSQAVSINWPSMMAAQDIINDSMTANWSDGLFTGNGLLGNMVYLSEDGKSLRIDVGRTDVYDHREEKGLSHLFGRARLPVGHFLLKPVGNIRSHTARQDLWNAEVRGTITTDKGVIAWRTLTFSEKKLMLLDVVTTGEEGGFHWVWMPEVSISPRVQFGKVPEVPYAPNPAGTWDTSGNICTYWQPMTAGGGYATAWQQKNNRILLSIGYSKAGNSGLLQAKKAIVEMAGADLKNEIEQHRQWWHRFYQASFLSVPDARIQSFYWNQLYKMASATRKGLPAMDLQGPWTYKTPWPAYWFNLNIQLAYSPLYTANHLDLAASLVEMIDKNAGNLSLNVPAQYRDHAIAIGRSGGADLRTTPVKVTAKGNATAAASDLELGNLSWMLYCYWLQYRYSMDETLKERLIPLLRKSTRFYLNVLSRDTEGILHLPYSSSPEYPDGITRDCNYALSLFRWSCQTLLELAPHDGQAGQWKDVLQHLTPYPADSTGLRIGRDVGFTKSHRHYSHLLMIYPLQLMNWEQPENRILIEQSLNTWHRNPSALQGYSFTGGASIYEMMGRGNEAYQYINRLLNKYVRRNTMYLETGPVIETPLAAAQTIQEMALQCRDGKAFIFHAVPDEWKDMAFHRFRAAGAFLISAVRQSGATKWIQVESLVGGKLRIVASLAHVKARSNGGAAVAVATLPDGSFEWDCKKGETVVFFSDAEDLRVSLTAIDARMNTINSWGVK